MVKIRENCYAINPWIQNGSTGSNFGRVAGNKHTSASMSGNYARSDMSVYHRRSSYSPVYGTTTKEGADIAHNSLRHPTATNASNLYRSNSTDPLRWDFTNVWVINEHYSLHPTLRWEVENSRDIEIINRPTNDEMAVGASNSINLTALFEQTTDYNAPRPATVKWSAQPANAVTFSSATTPIDPATGESQVTVTGNRGEYVTITASVPGASYSFVLTVFDVQIIITDEDTWSTTRQTFYWFELEVLIVPSDVPKSRATPDWGPDAYVDPANHFVAEVDFAVPRGDPLVGETVLVDVEIGDVTVTGSIFLSRP